MLIALSTLQPCNSLTQKTIISPTEQYQRFNLKFSQNSQSFPSVKEACKHGNLNEAFLSLTSSTQPPSQQDYSSILDLCAAQKALFPGQQIHSHILKTNSLFDDGFLSTKLIFMYGKCGLLSAAEMLFGEMPERTVFTWNALIGAYSSFDMPKEAIDVYRLMRESEVMPDAHTFASVLKACAECEDLDCGSDVHCVAIKFGLSMSNFINNALIAMYGKCWKFDEASKLFGRLPDLKDVVSWNSMISACLRNGEYLEVLSLFRDMQKVGLEPNSYTVVGVLQACTELMVLRLGQEMHASLLKRWEEFEIYVANALVVMYAKCNKMCNALTVFDAMGDKDNVSWNSVLSGYVQNGFYDDSIDFFYEMLDGGFKTDRVSVINMASSLGRLGKLLNGMEMHAYAIKHGFSYDLEVGNTLIDMYAKCSHVHYAERVFYQMTDKDFITWTTAIAGFAQNSWYIEALSLFTEVQKKGMQVDKLMIESVLRVCSGLARLSLLKQIHGYITRHDLLDQTLQNTILDCYATLGKMDEALRIFGSINDKDIISWTRMISCYVHNGDPNSAIRMFMQMLEADIELDSIAVVTVLQAAACLSSLLKGKEIHGFLIKKILFMDVPIISSLVDMYANCGSITNSFKVFNMVQSKDLILWTTMINASGMHGQGKEAIHLYRRMLKIGLEPDHVTFMALLHACSHSGLINEGKILLEEMKNICGLEPWPEHYTCLVDLLARSGGISEAFEFINSMPSARTEAAWCALLGGCQVHSNYEVGEIAARELLKLEPENPGNYVLVSNFFATLGKWKDVEKVRCKMEEKGLNKEVACSWIEVRNSVHVFTARDNVHEDSLAIYSKLAEITARLEREVGYIADTRFVLHDVSEHEKIKMLYGHSERLAIAFALIKTPEDGPIHVTKNLRVCSDCHEFTKLVSKLYAREIVVRDANRFHHFRDGLCSCREFW